ncbi:MAG: pyridoxine 5'-phosphate synthase [Polyangiaceae bacterium]|nr:pyridoxine 5'-phosphate synthase [Polyangiaceae bacterium]
MVIRLHVNIDHVATVRNARGTAYPDPVFAAQLCEQAGADGITCHLREDRRHMRDADVERIRASVSTLLNLEMAATEEMTTIAARLRPDVITLVPERREERTTEGGLDVVGTRPAIERVAEMCTTQGIKLSLFIAVDLAMVEASHALGVEQVELHTGEYCHAAPLRREHELARLATAARCAQGLGLEVAAGHGLNRHNVIEVAALPEIVELNIGHALISDAVFFGLKRAIDGFREAIDRGIGRRPL